jgi:dihydrofolate synthase/folylpolyglutamate synthase
MNLEAWLELLERRHPSAIDLGLGRCGAVYCKLGSPRPAKKVFTVAGTNGKGSTVAYLAAISAGMGSRYGTYTSPHIFRFNERICIMGEAVTDTCLERAFELVEEARGDVSLTYFEFTTLAGLLILQQSDLDYAILEVGLGGRLDTVNLVDTDCAVITPIGLDHQDFLGPDLDSIAAEKAGIIRPGAPVVCTEKNPPIPVIQQADKLQAPLYRRGLDYDILDCFGPADGQLRFTMAGQSMNIPKPTMAGDHQVDNLAAALAAFSLLNPACLLKGDDIAGSLRGVSVPGRLQAVSNSPEILLDVGHNELAATVVADFLMRSGKTHVTCVLAMLADKDVEEVATVLGKVVNRWLCAATGGDRGQSGDTLAQRVKSALPLAEISAFGNLEAAMQHAVSIVAQNETILVFGSFLTMSGAAAWVRDSIQHDGHDAAKITQRGPGTDR